MNRSTFSAIVLLSLALPVGGMQAAQAAVGSADIAVSATVRTPVCTLSASGAGVYHYDLLSQSILPSTGHVPLTPQDQTWTVDCGGGRTHLMYAITDNRAASASTAAVTNFGLGAMEGVADSRIGYYTLTLTNAKVDGVAKSVLYVSADGTYADATPVVYYQSRRGYSWHTGTGSGGAWADLRSQAGSRFEVDVRVSPFLASRSVVGGGKPITENIDLDGSATVTFSFGL